MSSVVLDDFTTNIGVDEIGEMSYYEDFLFYGDTLYNRIEEIYDDSLLDSSKVDLVGEVTIGEGFTSKALFDTAKLVDNRSDIVVTLDELYGEYNKSGINAIECGVVGRDKSGELAAIIEPKIEKMVKLGTAVGALTIMQHHYEISSLNDGDKLYVVRNVSTKEDTNNILK